MLILNQILVFIIVIGVLVAVHEFGHFIAARLTGMRVDVFAIGMGRRLFGYNKITGFTWGNLPDDWDGNGYTDYRLSLLPIGGYVKIAGMVDESFDTDYTAQAPQPWEFRSKNAWQKAFVITAGVIMNILLAYVIYTGTAFVNGETIYQTTTINYIEPESPLFSTGLRPGDKVMSIGNDRVTNWKEMLKNLTTEKVGENKQLVVQRGSETVTLTSSGKKIVDALSDQKSLGIYPDGLVVVAAEIAPNTPAHQAGLFSQDTILSIEGVPIVSPAQLQQIVSGNKEKALSIRWKRGADVKSSVVTPNSDGKIGVNMQTIYNGPKLAVDYSFTEALGVGAVDTKNAAAAFFDMIGQIIKGKISFKQSIGGPIRIAEIGAQTASLGITAFLTFMAVLSVTLAVINILPFPALDGGHLVFIILEGVARREVPVKIKLGFQQAGVIILLGFMIFVLYNDIVR